MLLEREGLLATFAAAVTEARRGHGSVLVLTGEAGAGKTSVARAMCDSAPLPAYWGYCDPIDAPVPLGPFLDIAASAEPSLRRALRGATTARAALLVWLAEAAARVVVIEDLHWVDDASADVVRFLARRIHNYPAVLLLTCRDEVASDHPMRRLLGELTTARTVLRLDVPPLSENAVAELARDAGREARDVYALTGGSPFLVRELLSGDGEITATLSDSVMSRLARLPEPTRAVVEELSVRPGRTRARDVDETIVDAAVVAGVLTHERQWLSFRHELVRRAVEESLPPGRRRELHQLALRRLEEDHGVDLAVLAYHAEESGDPTAALEHHRAAGARASAAGAHRQAADHYRAAVAHSDALPLREQVALLRALSAEDFTIGRTAEALQTAADAVALAEQLMDPLLVGDAIRWQSRVSPSAEDSSALAAQAIEVLEPLGTTAELTAAYAQRATERMLDRDLAAALEWADRVVQVADDVADAASAIAALQARGSARLLSGDRTGEDDLRAAVARAGAAGLEFEQGRAWVNLVSAAGEACLYDISERAAGEALPFLVGRDLDSAAAYLRAWQARTRFEQGAWQEAEEFIHATFTGPTDPSDIAAMLALTIRGRLQARRGDPSPWPALDQAKELAEPTGTLQRIAPTAAARSEARWLLDMPDDGTDGLLGAYRLACERLDQWAIGELGIWMWRHGLLDRLPDTAAPPYRLHVAGDLSGAAAEWDALSRPYDAAAARADSTDLDELRHAYEIFQLLGARPAARRAARRLRERGVRGLPRGPRPQTRADPRGLTEREREVLHLVHEGLSDAQIAARLFLSTRTVGHHVSALLRKTGTQSRRQLTVIEPTE